MIFEGRYKDKNMIKIIAAMTPKRVIGNKGKLPWMSKDVPGELKWFQEVTLGHTVIMGRSTWESLPPKFRPLSGRYNIVVSRTMSAPPLSVIVARSLKDALRLAYAGKDVWIIGGAQMYGEALANADELYLTFIDKEFGGDTYFPEFADMFSFVEDVRHGEGWAVKRFVKKV